MAFDCTTPDYDRLYQPWLERGKNMLLLGQYKPGQRVLDLCGGTGIVSKTLRAMDPQADVHLLDLNPRCETAGVRQLQGRAEDAGSVYAGGTFDLVVCRQSLGYLNLRETIISVAKVLKVGGKFVFNTFTKPKRWSWKSYSKDGISYRQAHIFLFGKVLHLQMAGWSWDVSCFRYHSPTDINKYAFLWFDFVLTHEADSNSNYWVCTKKHGIVWTDIT